MTQSRDDTRGLRPRTRAVQGGRAGKPGPMSTPVVHSSVFSFDSLDALNEAQNLRADGAFYQRHGHPTVRACEQSLAALEGAGEALLFPSGMAAISSVFLSALSPGDHIVAIRQCYGGTLGLIQWGVQQLGWQCDLVDAREPGSWAAAFRAETKLFHIESPTNPVLCIVDLAGAAKIAHARGARLSLDNTVASPLGQHGLALGADVVTYSVTKSISGHSDLLAGAVLGERGVLEPVWNIRKVLGPFPAPEVAWQIERSLKTLPLRVEAANANALELSRRLASHEGVAAVHYPGLETHAGHTLAKRQMTLGYGPLLSFDVRGGARAAETCVDALRLVRHAPSLGGADSMACLPAHTSHIQLGPEGRAKAGIPEGLVRVSAGIEDVDDLWSDLSQALAVAAAVNV